MGPSIYPLSWKLRCWELFFTVVVTFCRSFLVKSSCFVSFTSIEKCAIANTRKSPQEPSTVQKTTVPPAGGSLCTVSEHRFNPSENYFMGKGRRLLGKDAGGSIMLTKGGAILFILGSLLISGGGDQGVCLEETRVSVAQYNVKREHTNIYGLAAGPAKLSVGMNQCFLMSH